MKLGLVECTNDEYHSGEGVSKSHLGVIAQSPLHYWAAYINPEREPRTATPDMIQGTAIHGAILEPDLFTSEFVAAPNVDRRTKEGKVMWAEFVEAAAGKTILTHVQYDTALACRDAVLRNDKVARALEVGQAERSYFALDANTGALVKCRYDWESPFYDLDVKSAVDASPDGFMRAVLKYHYHAQVAWYRDVRNAALDVDEEKPWYFLAIEKVAPYAMGLYTLPDEMVKSGRLWAQQQLRRIVDCKSRNHWPDYSEQITELTAPAWMRKQLGIDSPEMDFA